MATILYDNDSPHMTYVPRSPEVYPFEMYLGGSLSQTHGLTVMFSGTSITLYGFGLDEVFHVILDGERQSEGVHAKGATDEITGAFYQSPTLTDATHNLTIMAAPGNATLRHIFGIDFATVTAGENTPLQGERLIVDDSDPSLVFEGDWVKSINPVLSGQDGSRNAYANTTHQISSSPKASFAFQFNGTTVSVLSSTSQPPTTNTIIAPSISTTVSLPDHPGISRAALLGAVIGPVIFGVIIILLLLFLSKKKLLFGSYRRRPNTVNPFRLLHSQTRGLSQSRVYNKPSFAHESSVVESPIHDEDLPFVGISATNRSRWWERLWRHPRHGTVEAFPLNWDPSTRQPMIRQKPILPNWNVAQHRASRLSDAGSETETIAADPRLQELEDMVLALQEEIEETRQDRFGAQNGALMRALVTNRVETSDERGERDHGDHGSVAMSTTVV
ncbi:hypothetical protein C0993_000801 [Termitomyces sp. T159_Od127]|nr:hypothetical protein C0993_000801 [Termitomyces sp. T159_Od127]